jgi:uroporphyrin-III C-methyltransferase/precorrin-2 dehydrogenase/sirohydrochlorin ferrochelatase
MSDERQPSETRPQRMQPLARLPVFYALSGKRVVIAGGSAAAAWKAELLSAAGAHVQVFATQVSDEMKAVAADTAQGPVVIAAREWTPDDLAGAAMAIGAYEHDAEAARFAQAARTIGVPVNVIDMPAFCDFAFGAIVNRSPLVVGISTDGAAPVFGQMVRAKIEAMLPAGFARWTKAAQDWRSLVQVAGLTFSARRRFWQRFTARAVENPNAEPQFADFESLLADVRGQGAESETGSVMLVGAGPGDPELLTLRAVRALQSADVILFDDLVSREILDFARREARKMLVGKTGYGPSCKQTEINELMVKFALAGRRVVRLKGGDPMIFGRAGEELDACRNADIPVEVVPGITAAQGVAGTLGVSLTNRDQVRRVQYITGHSRQGALPKDLNWKSLTDPGATTAIYMPTKTLAEFVANATKEGLDPQLPAVAVARATRPDQVVIAATIAELPSRLAVVAPEGPLLVMIGQVFAAQLAMKSEPRRREAL